jgi:hypothetical protein
VATPYVGRGGLRFPFGSCVCKILVKKTNILVGWLNQASGQPIGCTKFFVHFSIYFESSLAMGAKMKSVAIYLRVSTTDQTTDNQRREL